MVLWMGRPSKPMSSNFSRRACLPVTLSSWTTCRAIRSRVYAKLSPRRGPTSAISRLTAQISILSSSSLPSSRRCSGRRPRELSMTCSRQSPMLSPSSPHRNAPTMSQTAAIATQPENALVEIDFVLDDMVEVGSRRRQHHLHLELAFASERLLAHDAFNFTLRGDTDLLEKPAHRNVEMIGVHESLSLHHPASASSLTMEPDMSRRATSAT